MEVINSNKSSQAKVQGISKKLQALLEDLGKKLGVQKNRERYLYYRGCWDMLLVFNGEIDIADMNHPIE